MEQKAKRIGKLNIIDLLAILLIAAVLVLAAWKFIGRNGDSIDYERPQTKVTYQVKVEGVAPELYENCQAHLPSPLMASGALVGGQIEAVEKETYQVLDANGNWVTDPDHVTLIFTVTTTTPTAEVMTTKVGDQEVRIGKKDYILKSEYVEINGGVIVTVPLPMSSGATDGPFRRAHGFQSVCLFVRQVIYPTEI